MNISITPKVDFISSQEVPSYLNTYYYDFLCDFRKILSNQNVALISFLRTPSSQKPHICLTDPLMPFERLMSKILQSTPFTQPKAEIESPIVNWQCHFLKLDNELDGLILVQWINPI